MSADPVEIGVDRLDKRVHRRLERVCVAGEDIVDFGEGRRDLGLRFTVQDRNQALMMFNCIGEFLAADLGRDGIRTNDEDKGLGGVDGPVDTRHPLVRWRNAFPINPGFVVTRLERLVQTLDKIGVLTRIGDEYLSHPNTDT